MTMFRDLGSSDPSDTSQRVVNQNFASQNHLIALWIDEIGCPEPVGEGIWNFGGSKYMTMFRHIGSARDHDPLKFIVSQNFAPQIDLLPLWIEEIGCPEPVSEGIWNF